MENLNAENLKNEIQSLITVLKDCGGWVKRGNGEGWFNHEILADALVLITSQEQRIKELTEENEKLTINMSACGLAATRLKEDSDAWQKQLISMKEKSDKSYYELACETEDLRAQNEQLLGWQEIAEGYQKMLENSYEWHQQELKNIFAKLENHLGTIITPTVRANGTIGTHTIDGVYLSIEDYTAIRKKYLGV